MICKNCGAEINKESYCPSCGMELLIPYSKSLKEKYLAGEYIDRHDSSVSSDKNHRTYEEYSQNSTEEYDHYYGNESQETNEPEESGSSGFLATFLILIIALLIGFLIGMIIFSGTLQSLPGM
jgi:hypothetical protein